jgi:ribosomal protein S18 acetylase RimI-like enzyme
MAESYERAWAFDAALQERSAATVQRFDRGAVLFTDAVPRVYDANFVRLDDVSGLSADDAELLVDSLQHDLRHRRLLLPGDGAGIAEELVRRGWSASRIATMEYTGPRERGGDPPDAELVDSRAIRGAREAATADRDPDLTQQIADYTERLAAANDGLVFAAFADGEIGAFCALFEDEGAAEIDEVTTLDRFRRRGLGTAVVEAALRTALAHRADLVFLNADATDWPMRWYERLGFRTIGRRFEVYRMTGIRD